jgi:DNA-binding transcriptional LysR family regulator
MPAKTVESAEPNASPKKKLLQRRHIEALVAIADGRSVHQAARGLGVPQPVVSRLLAEAESVLGARLFERSSHGSKPTLQGEGVLARARFVLRGIERLDEAIAASGPSVRLGCIPRAMHTLMPRLLDRMHPNTGAGAQSASAGQADFHLNVAEGSSKALLDGIARGSMDFAILRCALRSADAADDLVAERLYDERTVIICAAAHHGIPTGPVTLDELVTQRWALPEADTTSRVAFDQFWSDHGLPQIRPVIETRSFESNLALVAGTRLISIAPESVARVHAGFGLLRILRVRRELPGNPVMLAFNRMAAEDPVLNGFRTIVHAVARELQH